MTRNALAQMVETAERAYERFRSDFIDMGGDPIEATRAWVNARESVREKYKAQARPLNQGGETPSE